MKKLILCVLLLSGVAHAETASFTCKANSHNHEFKNDYSLAVNFDQQSVKWGRGIMDYSNPNVQGYSDVGGMELPDGSFYITFQRPVKDYPTLSSGWAFSLNGDGTARVFYSFIKSELSYMDSWNCSKA